MADITIFRVCRRYSFVARAARADLARYARAAYAIPSAPLWQVAFIIGRTPGKPEKFMTKMKRRIDSDIVRYEYSRRLGIIEPVFGNVRHTKKLNRFTLRGKRKVSAQWQLYCLVHNIEKIQRYGRLEERMRSRRRRAA